MSIIIEKHTPKEFKKLVAGESMSNNGQIYGVVAFKTIDGNGNHILHLRKGASTSVKVHELSHAKLGHSEGRKSYYDMFIEELDADIETYHIMGKSITWKTAIGAVDTMFRLGLNKSEYLHNIFNSAVNHLKSKGYNLSKSDRNKLWWYIREDIMD